MGVRAEQREATRNRIIAAAVEAFSERGFHAASTRDIADRAGIRQGLVTYHFASKDELWRVAVTQIFESVNRAFFQLRERPTGLAAKSRARESIRIYTRFAAQHPELFRIMLSEAHVHEDRMRWLVETHLRPLYEIFRERVDPNLKSESTVHAFYTLVGAASTIFALAPECKQLTSLDPMKKEAIEAHANYISALMVPD